MQQSLVLAVKLCVEQCQLPVILMAARSGRGLWDGTKLIACTPLRGCSFFVEEMCSKHSSIASMLRLEVLCVCWVVCFLRGRNSLLR